MAYGGLLLFLYSLGHCALIIIADTSMGWVKQILEFKRLNSTLRYVRKGSGVFIILIGLFLIWSKNG